MPVIAFTAHLHAVAPSGEVRVAGATVAEALGALAPGWPLLRNYLLDDQGRVRKHVAIFVGGELVPREAVLTTAIAPDTEIFVMQALSGG